VNISGVLPGIFLIGVFLGGKEKPQAHACGDESQTLFEIIYIDQQEARTIYVLQQRLIYLTYQRPPFRVVLFNANKFRRFFLTCQIQLSSK